MPEQLPPAPPVVHVPVIEMPVPVQRDLTPYIDEYLITKAITPFSFVSTDAIHDNFAIIPVERYDARYQSEYVTVLVHVFNFPSRAALEVVLNSEFYHIINLGTAYYHGNHVALFLTQEDHRVALWPNGNQLIYVETFIPDFVEREIVDAYLEEYPSDLETNKCSDSDGDNRFMRGNTTQVKIDSTIMKWTDVCLRDFAPYRNKQYVPLKGLNEEDGLLEGRCEQDLLRPGFIHEYPCPRGCMNGACKRA